MIVKVGAICLVLAAATLPFNAAPSFDPWAWIVWGRDVLEGDLHTTTGPSWKPLPVLFTAPLSLLGDAAPDAWLVVARAATFGAICVAALLGLRLAGVAGAAITVALLLPSSWLWEPAMLGNSEGLLVLCVLAAFERELAGRHGQALGFAIAAGLLRPEAWPFLGLYAVWLVARDRRRLPAVGLGLALVPALWLLPELWGSGNLWRAAERAQEAGYDTPAFASRPALAVLEAFVRILPVVVILGLLAGAATVAMARGRIPRSRLRPALALAVVGAAWALLVAVMAELGFSGIDRYLFTPVAIAHVVAGVGLAWAFGVLAELRQRPSAVAAAAVLAVLAIGWQARVVAGWSLEVAERHGDVNSDLEVAIDRAGGEERLTRCGSLHASGLVTPPVAWRFGRHLDEVTRFPRVPGVLFSARLLPKERLNPPAVNRITIAPGHRTLARTAHWRVEAACR